MKRFLLKVFLFLTSVLVIAIVTDLWVSKTLASSESYAMGDAKIWNDILNNQINDELLIYGSSRAWRHFDPKVIEKETGMQAYNFGVDGHSFDIQHLRHELQLKHNTSPKVILYSVDVNTLNLPEGLYNDEQFLPFFYSDTLFNSYTKKYKNFSFTDYNAPLARYSGRKKALTYFIKEVIGWPQKKMRTKGFEASNESWNTDYERARKNKTTYYKKIDTNMVKRFDAFLKEMHSKKIAVILMYTPEHVLGQSLITNRAEIVSVFDSLAKKNNIPFLDYSKVIMNSNKIYFYNSLHLNAKGVEAFNNLYIKDLKAFVNSETNK